MTTDIQLTEEEREVAKALVEKQIQGLRDRGFEVEVVLDFGYAATVSVGGLEMLVDPMSLISRPHRSATVH